MTTTYSLRRAQPPAQPDTDPSRASDGELHLHGHRQMRSPDGRERGDHYAYDSLDRLTAKARQRHSEYTYDAAGHVASISSSNTGGTSVAYSYDSLNRLARSWITACPAQNTTTYTYDPASNVATVSYPNGLQSTFTYDQLNRLTELSTPPVADYKYTLGLTGIRTSAAESSGRTLNWNYDGIYRLTNESHQPATRRTIQRQRRLQAGPGGQPLSEIFNVQWVSSGRSATTPTTSSPPRATTPTATRSPPAARRSPTTRRTISLR